MNATDMVNQFLRHRKAVLQFCDVMPDEHFEFAPWAGALSFAALALHIAGAGDYYLASAQGVPFQAPDAATLPTSPAAIRSYLQQKTEEQAARLGDIHDLTNRVTVRGNEIEVGILLGQMREHEAHHKGQMMTMLRMCGVTDKLFYAV